MYRGEERGNAHYFVISLLTAAAQELEIQKRGAARLGNTHDISLVEEHIADVETFASDLRGALDAVWSTRNEGRYTEVHVLLLSWEDNIMNMGVKVESERLRGVFTDFYHFEVENYLIPSECQLEISIGASKTSSAIAIQTVSWSFTMAATLDPASNHLIPLYGQRMHILLPGFPF